MMDKCKDCKWWDIEKDEKTHIAPCRKNAPIGCSLEVDNPWECDNWSASIYCWPFTYESDWCGEFMRRKAKHGRKVS